MADTLATPPTPTPAAPVTPAAVARMSSDQFADYIGISDAPTAETTPPPTAPTETPPPTEAAPTTTTTPTGERSEPTPAAPLPFTVLDESGQPLDAAAVQQLAARRVRVKADGQELELAVPDLVRRAQSEAGAQRAQRQLTQQLQAQQTREQQLMEQIAQLREIGQRLAADDEFREATRADLEHYNAPEQQLARLQAETAERQRRESMTAQQMHAQQAAASFFTQNVAPHLDAIRQEVSGTVTEEELLGRLQLDTAHLLVNGRIPPSNYPELAAYVQDALPRFARQRASERGQADTTVRAAKESAQKAKNAMGAALRPQGGPATAGSLPTPSKPAIRTVKDASAFALSAFTGN